MRRNFAPFACAVASCAILVACGGGGGSPSPTPTPTPTTTGTGTPTPSPTPTPTPPPVEFNFSKAFTTTIANASYAFAYFVPDSGGAEVWSDGSRRDGQSKITYAVSPEKVEFTWPDGVTLRTFVAADLQTATAKLRTYKNGIDELIMELPFQHVLRVNYKTEVPFTRETVPGKLRSNRYTIFFNAVTTTSAITSNLSYTGTAQVAGGKPGTTPPGVISSPQTTLTVAASDKKITGTITIRETVNGAPVTRAVLPISATVGSNSFFSGSTEDTTNAFKGNFIGSLAGPTRQEVILIFNVEHTDGREYIGSFIGG